MMWNNKLADVDRCRAVVGEHQIWKSKEELEKAPWTSFSMCLLGKALLYKKQMRYFQLLMKKKKHYKEAKCPFTLKSHRDVKRVPVNLNRLKLH